MLDLGSAEGALVATRHYLTPDQKIADVPGAMKGLILLRRDSERLNKRVCNAFTKLPTTESTQRLGVPANRITPTVWLVKSMPADGSNCDTLLAHYDYDAAAVYFAHLNREAAKSPLLAAVLDDKLAFINLAKASKNDIDALVPAWSRALVANNRNDIDLQREVVRRVCQTAGVNPKNVTAEVLEIIDGNNNSLWKLLRQGVGIVANIVPYGDQLLQGASGTCQQINQTTV
jgi:hypothetical protein